MSPSMVTQEELQAETRALREWSKRVARDDADWNLYYEGDFRPRVTWWQRLLKIPPEPKDP